MRVIITGSRSWHCPDLARRVVRSLAIKHGPALVIVHGAARGVDLSFAEAATELGVAQEPHPADWAAHGRGGGPIRNAEMIAAGAGLCLAFHPDLIASKGTGGCARLAIKAGIPTWWTRAEGVPPGRIDMGFFEGSDDHAS